MILDTDAVIRRILIVVFCVFVSCAFGLAVWYNSNLKNEFNEGKTETNYLRQETSRLGAMNQELRETTSNAFNDFKKAVGLQQDNINSLSGELKDANSFAKLLQQEQERSKIETKQELSKLYERSAQLLELLKQKELEIKAEAQRQKVEHEKLKNETRIEHNNLQAANAALNQNLKAKEQELESIKIQLQKEVEWRNRYYNLSR